MSRVNPRLVYWIAQLYEKHEPELTAAHRDILACLATRHLGYSDGQGSCSAEQLAADTRTHRATVQRALASGQKLGMLRQTRRGRRLGDGTVTASEWAVIYPPVSTSQQCDIEPGSTAQQCDIEIGSTSQRPPSQRRTGATPTEKKQKTRAHADARTRTRERPPWCGECAEQTRQRFDAEDRPYRCPVCHPLADGRP